MGVIIYLWFSRDLYGIYFLQGQISVHPFSLTAWQTMRKSRRNFHLHEIWAAEVYFLAFSKSSAASKIEALCVVFAYSVNEDKYFCSHWKNFASYRFFSGVFMYLLWKMKKKYSLSFFPVKEQKFSAYVWPFLPLSARNFPFTSRKFLPVTLFLEIIFVVLRKYALLQLRKTIFQI